MLDDPLSAVDAHVGQHIFKHCIKGTLWNKTILFATHQLQVMGSLPPIAKRRVFPRHAIFPQSFRELRDDAKECLHGRDVISTLLVAFVTQILDLTNDPLMPNETHLVCISLAILNSPPLLNEVRDDL